MVLLNWSVAVALVLTKKTFLMLHYNELEENVEIF